ncbi:PucR family transcriptional regulator ligand-binding domain-containing protein [Brevibacterium album]|uniref:PucR family transcriptional regulator ligand-binding domain-containing protein n=1 Tax=Brevibacterium album TaxID=417948 RepID=UPI0003F5996D|nr:PucR family transcriptional regulator ligand-binding domain-containing protein [Brevibacterium album]
MVDSTVTVRSVLDVDELRRGLPDVLTGTELLDRPVSWVHIAETEEVASLLEGGEVILSSSAMFRSSPERTRAFLRRLQAAGAAAFVIEVVDVSGHPDPRARRIVAEAASGIDLPVVVLSARVRFVRITQAAHRMLIGAQLARVEFARRVHEVFTELSLEGADEQRIVAVTAELADTPVVLEDAVHRVLAYESGEVPADALLADWPRIPAQAGASARVGASADSEGQMPPVSHAERGAQGVTGARAAAGVQVPVGVPGRRWGRLVAPFASSADADAAQVLERAGQALTLARMASQGERDLLQQATVEFLHELMGRSGMGEQQALARAASLGMRPSEVYVPVAIRLGEPSGAEPRDAQLRERALREEFGAAARQAGVPLLSGGLRSGVFAAVLGLASDQDCDAVLTAVLTRVNASFGQLGEAQVRPEARVEAHAGGASAVLRAAGASAGRGAEGRLLDVGVGRSSARITEAGAELESAIQVAGIVATMQVHRRPFHRFADVRLRGVLARLREAPVLRAFAEAELGPLLSDRSVRGGEAMRGARSGRSQAGQSQAGRVRAGGGAPGEGGASAAGGSGGGAAGDPEALRFLEVLLREGGSKTAVARALHLSRPAVYARVRRLEERLGVSLEDAESRTSLHAALIWLQTEGLGGNGSDGAADTGSSA